MGKPLECKVKIEKVADKILAYPLETPPIEMTSRFHWRDNKWIFDTDDVRTLCLPLAGVCLLLLSKNGFTFAHLSPYLYECGAGI